MKKKQLLSLVLLCYAFVISAQVSLFDDSIIHEIRITSSESNLWQNIDDDYQNNLVNGVATDVPYRNVTLEIDGTVLASVGVRQKGFLQTFL